MDLSLLCEHTNMPAEVTKQILQTGSTLHGERLKPSMDKLCQRESWTDGIDELRSVFSEDTDGIQMLTCMLLAGISTYETYHSKGISDAVYFATFGCFSRFVKEHKTSYGHFGFDRDWWTCRQLSMEEFRIGELEYEMVMENNEALINIHIPSDTRLTRNACHESYQLAARFFLTYFPDYPFKKMTCYTWLLAPSLKDILHPDSHILEFQKDYVLEEVEPDAPDVLEWVFKNPNLSLEELPEDTSLQKNMKQYLLSGGKVGVALGILSESVWR